jgi:hypothetical protein
MPRKIVKKIKISRERKFSPHFLDLKKIVPEAQEFEKPKRRSFLNFLKWTVRNTRTQEYKDTKIQEQKDHHRLKLWMTGRKAKLRINFITPGERRIRREKEELELKQKIDRHSEFLSSQFFHSNILKNLRMFISSFGSKALPTALIEVKQEREERQISFQPKKRIISFILVCLLFVFSLQSLSLFQELKNKKQLILAASLEAYQNLFSKEFEKAQQGFSGTQKQLDHFGVLIYLVPHLSQTRHILKAGELMAEAGGDIGILGNEEKDIGILGYWDIGKIRDYLLKIVEVYPKIKSAKEHLLRVDLKYLPEEYRESFLENKKKLEVLSSGLESLVKYIPDLSKILGFKETKHYLIIFQNNNEIRPTGGFMGSLAFLDIYQGKIKNLEIPSGGPYDFRKFLKVNIAPPKPLRRINYQWQLQDANWFPDFPTSAEKILWFLENTDLHGFDTDLHGLQIDRVIDRKTQIFPLFGLDGVIAINASFMPKILEIIGPIEMPEYGRTITSENFIEETQKIVELESDKKRAKKFIADLMPIVLDKILKEDTEKHREEHRKTQIGIFQNFSSVLFNALDQKEIQLYFTDKNLEDKIKVLGWAGEIKDSPAASATGIKDYLMVVNTNIGGGKTDGVIKEKILHQAEIQKDDSIIDQVTITRTHQGQSGDYFTGVKNINYLRIYVPQGSQLLGASGFEIPGPGNFRAVTENASTDEDLIKIEKNAVIDEASGTRVTHEFGKTCFANWVQVEPGESKTVSFRYKLPFTLNRSIQHLTPALSEVKGSNLQHSVSYSLFWQKQSGTRAEIESKLILLENYEAVWQYPGAGIIYEGQIIKFSSILDKDKIWAIKMKTKNNI